MDFYKARVSPAEIEWSTNFQGQVTEVKYSEKQTKLVIRKVQQLFKKIVNTNIFAKKLQRNPRKLK